VPLLLPVPERVPLPALVYAAVSGVGDRDSVAGGDEEEKAEADS
jgi:hypothetical protein